MMSDYYAMIGQERKWKGDTNKERFLIDSIIISNGDVYFEIVYDREIRKAIKVEATKLICESLELESRVMNQKCINCEWGFCLNTNKSNVHICRNESSDVYLKEVDWEELNKCGVYREKENTNDI